MTFYNFNHKRTTLTILGKRYFIGRNLNYAGHSKITSLRCPSDPHDDGRRGVGFNQTDLLRIYQNYVVFHLPFRNIFFVTSSSTRSLSGMSGDIHEWSFMVLFASLSFWKLHLSDISAISSSVNFTLRNSASRRVSCIGFCTGKDVCSHLQLL